MIQEGDDPTYFLTLALAEIQVLRMLTTQPSNIYTTKLIDIIVPDVTLDKPIRWIALVMDYVESDLRTVLMNADKTGLGET